MNNTINQIYLDNYITTLESGFFFLSFPITHKHDTILLTRLEPPQVLATMQRTWNQSHWMLRTTVHFSVVSTHNLSTPCIRSFLSFSPLPSPSVSSPYPYPTNFKFFLKNKSKNTIQQILHNQRKNKTTPKKLNQTKH